MLGFIGSKHSLDCVVLITVLLLVFVGVSFADSPAQAQRRWVCCDEAKPVRKRFEEAKALETSNPDRAIKIYESIISDFPNWVDGEAPMSHMFSDLARWRIETIRCYKARGKDVATKTSEALFSLIKKAIQEQNIDQLEKLASCDFEVGFLEGDVWWAATPYNTASALIQFHNDFSWDKTKLSTEVWFPTRWSFQFHKFHNDFSWDKTKLGTPYASVVPLREESREAAFVFRKTPQGFSWSQFLSEKNEHIEKITQR